MQIKIRKMAHSAAILAACALSAYAQPVGQWDFNSGTLAGTVGAALDYADGAGADTQLQTQFGTTTSFGIPDIGGTAANVIKVPAATNETMGFTMPVASGPVGGELVNSYTIIYDILFPAESHGKLREIAGVIGCG
jgi:hypothetical protein